MSRYANVYRRPGLILIYASAKLCSGAHISAAPFITLSADVRLSEIGRAIQTAVDAYQEGVPAPDFQSAEWKELGRARHRAAGVRSERQFMADSRYIAVCEDDGMVRLTPSRNGGTRGPSKGFHFLPNMILAAGYIADHEGIGRAVLETWRRCQ